MEKAEILKKFLEKGMQLDYESLEYFSKNQEKINPFFQRILNGEKPTTLSLNFVLSLLDLREEGIEILKIPKSEKKVHSVDDLTKLLHDRYSFLKKILSSRFDLINPISLNKITPKTKHFSAIIMVKEKLDDEKAIIAEDETSEYKMFIDKEEDFKQILPDDVIGVVCGGEDRIKVRNIMWPDLQMKRTVNRTKQDVSVALISGKFDESQAEEILKRGNVKHLFYIGENGRITYCNGVQTDLESPATIRIEKDITFLLSCSGFMKKYSDFVKDENGFLVSLLKRRSLNPTFQIENEMFDNDPYLIDTVPDIFVVSGTKNNSSNNYKGTTIITLSDLTQDKKFWIINLKSRETINASLE